MSERAQRILVWLSLIGLVIFFLVLYFLLHMLPPPSPTWSASTIASFYTEHSTDIKWGATVLSWTSAFMVPITVVIAVQMSRHEKGKPILSFMAFAGGLLMTVPIVLTFVFIGVAAFTPTRAPEITAALHELAWLMLMSTTQWYVFLQIPVGIICLIPNSVVDSPFQRWFGYYTAFTVLVSETGAFAYLFKTGPFAWNGLIVFWAVAVLFGLWMIMISALLLKTITKQSEPLR